MDPALPDHPLPHGHLRLDDWGLIHVRGADARSFLHGQLTQDTLHLEPGRARLAGYCSPKGRLLASFVIWSPADDEVVLACSADLLAPTLKRLSMYVLRAKCRLAEAGAERPLWGLAGPSAAAVLGAAAAAPVWSRQVLGDAELIRLPDAVADGAAVPRWLWAGAEPPPLPAIDPAAWRWLEVHSGVARIVAATVEQFVPQMVNLELVGGVDFSKGCFPGQEVVARSQYRGTLKRRACIVESDRLLAPGGEVFHDADPGQPAGMVVLAGQFGDRCAALIEVKLAALEGGSLHANAADGPRLRPVALPYAVPTEAA